jgi:hypothetical protein
VSGRKKKSGNKQKRVAATLNVADALGVSTKLTLDVEVPVRVPMQQKLSNAKASESAESTKKAIEADGWLADMEDSLAGAQSRLARLRDAAKHEALKEVNTAGAIKEAEEARQALEVLVEQAQQTLAEIESGLVEALNTIEKPKEKPARGDRDAMREIMRQNLAKRQEYDAKLLGSIAKPLKALEGYAAKAKISFDAVDKVWREWQQTIKKHDSDADAARKKAEALAANQKAVETARKDYEAALAEKLVETAKGLGATPPDLDKTAQQMEEAAGKDDDWPAAGKFAGALSGAIARLRKQVVALDDLKKNYEEAKAKTLGRINKLATALDGAKVHDRTIIDDLRTLIGTANKQAQMKDWVAAADTIEKFETKVAEAETLVADFEEYTGGKVPKLLTGTVDQIWKKLKKGSTNADALAALETAYQDQCKVPRDEWLVHLGIAGGNVVGSPNGPHYTTFNDSVPTGITVNVADLSPDNSAALGVCGELLEQVAPTLRLHATIVLGPGNRPHRYWTETDAGNDPCYRPIGFLPVAHPELNVTYQTMVSDIVNKVKEVIACHGRIGVRKLGPKV